MHLYIRATGIHCLVIHLLFYNPPKANPLLSYSLLSKTFSMNSATSARHIHMFVPVLHCPSSTLYIPVRLPTK